MDFGLSPEFGLAGCWKVLETTLKRWRDLKHTLLSERSPHLSPECHTAAVM